MSKENLKITPVDQKVTKEDLKKVSGGAGGPDKFKQKCDDDGIS